MDDNLQEFTNPALYDAENRWGTDDAFYLDLAQQIGGPVLDVACGTGRLPRAIARAGLSVTGLDIVPAMLARARRLAADLPIRWIEADCRTMRLDRRFRLLLMTSHAFQFLLTDADQDRFLVRAAAHLEPGGTLAFETRNLNGRSYHRTPIPRHAATVTDLDGRTLDVTLASRYDPAAQIDHLRITRTWQDTGESTRAAVQLRYTAAADLATALRRHGFRIVDQFGDWSRAPLADDSPEIITICQA